MRIMLVFSVRAGCASASRSCRLTPPPPPTPPRTNRSTSRKSMKNKESSSKSDMLKYQIIHIFESKVILKPISPFSSVLSARALFILTIAVLSPENKH